MVELGVNIDHVATLRQARRTYEPDPVRVAIVCENGGADSITVHLREDRRHIQDRDLRLLRETVAVRLNLEMACEDEMIRIARSVRPDQVTLVPEKRQEVTTEGGLDVAGRIDVVRRCVEQLLEVGIDVSLFVDPESAQIDASAATGAGAIELHTGAYAAANHRERPAKFAALELAGARAIASGLALHAGHGLNYHNVLPVARLDGMHELNIGHAIVSRAIYTGMEQAVREMKRLITS
ncbi:MAG TPA: pyridoxine 5'-phosphate synthase [Planctomycetaceae bacterium]|nr:pyridoxine 5'-phosphate synthase [Planctomycetaceae bacterium]HRE99976.1 pyridoxine 5'-phosphate synthase [Pirellulaceae bacterium]